METTIVADNTKGQVLAFDGEEQVGQLDFTFKGQVMSIDHTQAFKKGMGIGALLVEAANEYAINHKLKVLPICSCGQWPFSSRLGKAQANLALLSLLRKLSYAWYQRHPKYKDILDEHAGEGVSCQL